VFNEKYDIAHMKKRIEEFPSQILDFFARGKSQKIVKKADKLVITGMGGSAIAGNMLADLFFDSVDVPIFVNRGYTLPAYVNEKTLLFVSSYSGNTEETVSSLHDGIEKGARIFVFTSNGNVGRTSRERGITTIELPPGYPPRSALGFSFFSMLGVLSDIFVIPFNEGHLRNLVKTLEVQRDILSNSDSEVKKLALESHGKIPVIYVSRRLSSVAVRWQTQINENSKSFAHINVIPEANHNEIVGLDFPRRIIKEMFVIFLRSRFYENDRIRRRFDLTKAILGDFVNDIRIVESDGKNKLEDMFMLIYKGDFFSYYLSLLLEVDPTPVERINLLKKRLSE